MLLTNPLYFYQPNRAVFSVYDNARSLYLLIFKIYIDTLISFRMYTFLYYVNYGITAMLSAVEFIPTDFHESRNHALHLD